jgi:RNA polymerase sigma-70 factor (ECF subfamily)
MSTDPETEELVRKATAGDRSAFEAVVTRYRSRLAGLIYVRMSPSARRRLDVEDVLQETTLAALKSLPSFEWRGEESFFRWLRQIAEHVILNFVNRDRTYEDLPAEGALPNEDTAPSKVMRRDERFDRLQEALASLSPDHRHVVLLAKIQGRAIQDIAVEMNRSPDAVTNLLSRALSKLREKFGDTESLNLPDRLLE